MPEAATIHDTATLEQGVDALLAEVSPGPTPTARTGDAELSGAVDQLLSQAAAPASPVQPIATLDAQLAEAADDLIAGEFAGEDEILNPPTFTPPPPPVSVPVIETPEPVPEIPAPAPVAPAPEPVVRPAPRVVLPPPTPEPVSGAALKGARAIPSPAAAASMAVGVLISPVVALLDGAATAVSAPLRNRSQQVRDMVGWIALVNFFLAVCVWVYLLAIRSPVAPDPEPLTSTSAKAPAGGHGEEKADAHASAKKPPKKDKAKAKPKDAHASAGH